MAATFQIIKKEGRYTNINGCKCNVQWHVLNVPILPIGRIFDYPLRYSRRILRRNFFTKISDEGIYTVSWDLLHCLYSYPLKFVFPLQCDYINYKYGLCTYCRTICKLMLIYIYTVNCIYFSSLKHSISRSVP